MSRLATYIPSPVVAVAANYHPDFDNVHVYVCGAVIKDDDSVDLTFANGHELSEGQLITIHLDNRTGVADYDAELSVYRLSYKGIVTQCETSRVSISPVEFQVFYGITVEYQFQQDGYTFPADSRQPETLPITAMDSMPPSDPEEQENKVGVLITLAEQRPHTTVMAFLSSMQDDIFFITFPNTFKSQLLKRDNRCYFAIDNRATFTFEQAIEWNYSIIKGRAFSVEKNTPLFEAVREEFIAKNPWEVGFFSNPDVEMFHVVPESVVCPTQNTASPQHQDEQL